MSSRHVRRALEQQQQQQQGLPASSNSPHEPSSTEVAASTAAAETQDEGIAEIRAKPRSVFAAVDSSSSDDENEAGLARSVAAMEVKTSTASKSGSKNKKKRGAHKSSGKKPPTQEEEEADALLDELLRAGGGAAASAGTSPASTLSPFRFDVKTTTLDPDEEVVKKLGGELRYVPPPPEEEADRGGGRRKRPAAAPAAARAGVRQHRLTRPEPNWPLPQNYVTGAGARMSLVSTEGEVKTFTFEAAPEYRELQAHYRALVATHDPQHIMELVQRRPYHVDSLLLLYDVFSKTQQNESAILCLRRALYALESWFLPSFAQLVGTGHARILLPLGGEAEEAEEDQGPDAGLNKSLLRVLVTSMKIAGKRDCFESALALGKLALSLNPDTDLGCVRLSLDYYAIKAEALRWYVDEGIAAGFDPAVLPSSAYSRARALKALNNLQAQDALHYALDRYPEFPLFVRDEPPASPPSTNDGLVLRLCELAGARQISLWNVEPYKSWLEEAREKRARLPKPPVDPNEKIGRITGKRRAYARATVFDLSDQVAHLPGEDAMLQQQQAEPDAELLHVPPLEPNVDVDSNVFSLFLQSLLPWARLPAPREPPPSS